MPAILAEDDMVQDLDPEERPRGYEAPRQSDVLGGGLGVTRGMVVSDDKRSGGGQ